MIFDIIEEEDFHKRTLLSCSLVSKSWRQASLGHLFRSLSFYPSCSIRNDSMLENFKNDEGSSKMKGEVRALTLTWLDGIIRPQFVDIIALFPRLLHLTLQGNLSLQIPRALSSQTTSPYPLQRLTLIGHTLNSQNRCPLKVEALHDILCLFPSLTTLQLKRALVWDAAGYSGDEPGRLPEIVSLVLRRVNLVHSLKELFQSTSLLSKLKCADIMKEGHRALSFVKAAAPRLQHLSGTIQPIHRATPRK